MRVFGKISVLMVLLVTTVPGLTVIAEVIKEIVELPVEIIEEPVEIITDFIFTTPPGCQNEPRPFEETSCGHCECANWSGRWEWMCYMAMCARPPCDDYVTFPGQCCPTCPNGPSCNYEGVNIHIGEVYVSVDGSACRCLEPNSYWELPEVMCEPPMPPPTPSGCEEKDKPYDNVCSPCECLNWNGKSEWACYMVDCFEAPCVDKIKAPGQCCEECPNGPNCEAFGVIISLKETRNFDGVVCHCSYETIGNPPIAVCESVTTLPPTPPILNIEEETLAATVD